MLIIKVVCDTNAIYWAIKKVNDLDLKTFVVHLQWAVMLIPTGFSFCVYVNNECKYDIWRHFHKIEILECLWFYQKKERKKKNHV